MTIFQVYFDETSTHRRHGTLRMIGLMAWHRTWLTFDAEWTRILRLPEPTRYWHTVTAHGDRLLSDSGQRLRKTVREQKEALFAQLIGRHGGLGIVQSVELELSMSDYEAHVKGQVHAAPKFAKSLGDMAGTLDSDLFIVIGEAMRFAAELARELNLLITPTDPVHIWSVFEESESKFDIQFEATAAYWALARVATLEARKILGPVIFLPGKGPLAQTTLQAADLFAWHVNRIAETGKAESPWNLMRGVKRNRRVVGPARLRELVIALNRGDRFQL